MGNIFFKKCINCFYLTQYNQILTPDFDILTFEQQLVQKHKNKPYLTTRIKGLKMFIYHGHFHNIVFLIQSTIVIN